MEALSDVFGSFFAIGAVGIVGIIDIVFIRQEFADLPEDREAAYA
jgi:hypothetical protein